MTVRNYEDDGLQKYGGELAGSCRPARGNVLRLRTRHTPDRALAQRRFYRHSSARRIERVTRRFPGPEESLEQTVRLQLVSENDCSGRSHSDSE